MQTITWKVRKGPDGWEGTISFPDMKGFAHSVTSQGSSPKASVEKAGALAAKLAENPAVQALLPPGSTAALKLAGKIAGSKAARSAFKKLRKLW